MRTLLVDIGNTRVKWALLAGPRPGAMRARPYAPARIGAVVARLPRDVGRVVAVSVAGNRVERAFGAAVRRRFGIPVEFVRSARRAAGVTNRYRDVWRLGADRWVAAIGAHRLAGGRPVLVASVGTALTVDLVDGDGRHLGGAIVPAPPVMIASLLAGTSGIRRRARGATVSQAGLFAGDTANALAAGARYAAAAFIERAAGEARRRVGARPVLLLAGGGAPALRRLLGARARHVPDVVLRGLAVLAAEAAEPRA